MTSVITTNKQIIIVLLSMFSLFLFPNNASGKDLGVKKAYFEKIIKKATIILNSKKISADDGLPVYLYIDL